MDSLNRNKPGRWTQKSPTGDTNEQAKQTQDTPGPQNSQPSVPKQEDTKRLYFEFEGVFARRGVHDRNRSQPSASVRTIPVWPCLWEVLQRWSFLGVADVSLFRFAWQAWYFVTFRRVLERVESRFAWQAQYFCDVVRRCVPVFVAGAAL